MTRFGGCACKIGPDELGRILRPIGVDLHPDLIVGLETGDDAAVWRRPDGRSIIATTDFFAPLVDDAATWGAIAATNAASDVYAMGGEPLFALNVVAWPTETLSFELLDEVMSGAAAVARDGGWVIAGGHSVVAPEPLFGQVIIGDLPPGVAPLTNAGARAGDVLVLTKAIGTGAIATAHKRAEPEMSVGDGDLAIAFGAAVASMCRLNRDAARAARSAQAHALTDVTGFGLLGHLHKMLVGSGCAAQIEFDAVPRFPGVEALVAAGNVPGGTLRNLEYVGAHLVGGEERARLLLADPQTSGGLLIACPPDSVDRLAAALTVAGDLAAVVGRVTVGVPGEVTLR